jgi:hypothetical protein
MAKQVRINKATGQVTGKRVHPVVVQEDAEWHEERREDVPTYNPDTQIVEEDNKLVGEEYVYGFTVRSLTAQELADRAAQAKIDHNAGIYSQINAIERNSARSMREDALNHGPGADGKTPKQRLQAAEDQVVALRAQRQ